MLQNNRIFIRWLLIFALMAMAALSLWITRQPHQIIPATEMHPIVLKKQQQLIAEAELKGIPILITDGLRTIEEQDALYRQGRSASGPIVTNVRGGDSYHNYGLAIDFALLLDDGDVIWDLEHDGNGNGESDWMEVVEIAKSLDFSWGGDWESFHDYPHLQMDFDYSIRELKRGKRPPANIEPTP